MKRIIKSLLVFVVGLIAVVSFTKVSAKEPAKVYLFYGEGCKYCAGAMTYLDSLEEEYGDMFDVVKYEVWNNADNQSLLEDVAAVFEDEVGGVPYIVIGEKTFAGYDLSGGFDADILEAIKKTYNDDNSFDVMEKLGTTVKKSNALLYVVLAVVVILEVALLGFAKKNAYANETVKEEKKEEPKKAEVKVEKEEAPKKTATKKATTKKAATKKAPVKKAEAKKTTKTATTKKTTTKKTAPKKTTKK